MEQQHESHSPGLTGYTMPSESELTELSLEEMEQEYAQMSRWYETLRENGQFDEAAELMIKLVELEDMIADMEADPDVEN